MTELMEAFVQYLKQYINVLTRGRQEFFLSFSDMEEEILQQLDREAFPEYCVVIVDQNDYSQAVRLRNDETVTKIVLLSGEGVKQIDSLKDFNEFSILPDDREVFWECIQKAFGVRPGEKMKAFLNTVLEETEVSFWTLFQYLNAGISKGSFQCHNMNRTLSALGIWNSREEKWLTKGKIRKMIRASRESVVESRLTKALMDNRIKKWVRTISPRLAKGDIQGILDKVPYEDVAEHLKGEVKSTVMDLPEAGNNASEEAVYRYSYEYKIKEQVDESIEQIEEEWLSGRDQDEELDLDWNLYRPVEGQEAYREQIALLEQQIAKMNLPSGKISQILEKLNTFKRLFEEVYKELLRCTPICLHTFCQKALPYTQAYFELLACLLTDEMIRSDLMNSGIVSGLEGLLCEQGEDRVKMPFYHPVSALHYMALQKMYEYILKQPAEEIADLKKQTLLALTEKLEMQFPVDFLCLNKRLYALDQTSLWEKGTVEFTDAGEEVVYSTVDFRVIHKQIVDYLVKHSVSTEITIALVEISDMNGLPQLVDKIRQMAATERYNIGRVDFLILSSKEELLKRQLSQMWDTIGTDDIVHFRFGRNHYYSGNGYEVKAVIDAADMVILADSSMLYYAPHLQKLKEGANSMRNRLKQFYAAGQVADYFNYGFSDIMTLWDTLQHAEQSREEGFWYWKSREIDSTVLAYINQAVEEDPDLTIVALCSNGGILNEIYKTKYLHAHRCKYNGKTITILNFAKGNHSCRLPLWGEAEISYSFKDFYDTYLDISDIQKKISPEFSDLFIKLYWEEDGFHSLCTAYVEDIEEKDSEWEEKCEKWLEWQLGDFPGEKNILSDYLSELWVSYWSEGARSITAALMVRRFYGGGRIETAYEQKENSAIQKEQLAEDDCMEAVKIQELFNFVTEKAVIDPQSVREFTDKYETDMLDRIIECDTDSRLLEEAQRDKLLKIQQKVKGEKES